MSAGISTRPRVIQLYKNLIYLGREYPSEPEKLTSRIHGVFMKNAGKTDPKEIEELIAKGNYIVKELEALYSLKKYRTIKRRYYDTEEAAALATPHLSKAIGEEGRGTKV